MKHILPLLILVILFTVSCKKDTSYHPKVYLYPNPVHSDLTIDIYHNKNNNFSATFYDNQGMEIKKEDVKHSNTKTIGCSELQNGIYFIAIEGKSIDTMIKIVKN